MFRLRAWQMRLFMPGLAGATDHRLEMHGRNAAEPRTFVGWLAESAANAFIVLSALAVAIAAVSLLAKALILLGLVTPQPRATARSLLPVRGLALVSLILAGATVGAFFALVAFHVVGIVKFRLKLARTTCTSCRRAILCHPSDGVSQCDFCANFNRDA